MPTKKKSQDNVFKIREGSNPFESAETDIHIYGENNTPCITDSRGYPTPKNRSMEEIVVDASEGFIPLWAKKVNLRWRFNPQVDVFFKHSDRAKREIRRLLAEAIIQWGDAAPVTFSERNDAWDFEIEIRPNNCRNGGCTLARAFFPDSGRHQLALYPKLFEQSETEQVETFVHELGHIFGLRHFFADVKEQAYPSVKFGRDQDNPFTIMNYGNKSILTDADKSDLKLLYQKVWSGELTEINGTQIITFYPYHTQVRSMLTT